MRSLESAADVIGHSSEVCFGEEEVALSFNVFKAESLWKRSQSCSVHSLSSDCSSFIFIKFHRTFSINYVHSAIHQDSNASIHHL